MSMIAAQKVITAVPALLAPAVSVDTVRLVHPVPDQVPVRARRLLLRKPVVVPVDQWADLSLTGPMAMTTTPLRMLVLFSPSATST